MAFHKNTLLFVALLPASVHLASADVAVPAGFEDLAKTQRMWTEVSLYGESLGLFETDINLETVSFVAPDTVVEAIRRQFNDDPALIASVQEALSVPLARNGNLACSSNGSATGCDYLETRRAAIIYDENNARISLFFDKRFLPKLKAENQWYQSTQDTENALIHQQNINVVADKDYQSATVQGNGALALTQDGYLNLDWTWLGQRSRRQQQQEMTLNNAWFRQDLWREYYVQLGEMDTRDLFSNAGGNINLSQLPLGKIRGLRTGSTRAWINPIQQSKGTPVTVLLSHDARIDARRGNELLASFYLNAGAQTLDTRAFPDGSYTVTLLVYENNRLTRTEQVPFTRTGITPFDRVEWFMQAGESANNVNDESSPVGQAGIRLPVTPTLALTSGAALMQKQQFLENALDWSRGFNAGPIDGVLSTRFSYLYGSKGQRGNIQQISYNDGFSLSVYRNALSAENCDTRSAGFDAVNGCYRSLSVMLSVPVGSWYATLGYSDNRNEGRYVTRRELPDTDDRHDAVLPWESVYMARSRTQAWQGGLSNAFSTLGLNINSSFNLFMRNDRSRDGKDKGGYLSMNVSFAHHRQGNASGYTSLGMTWQHQQQQKNQLSYNMAHNWYADARGENEYGLSASGINSDSLNASAYTRQGGRFGNASLTVSDAWRRQDQRHTLSSSGNYSSTLALSRSGLWLGRWSDGRPASAIAVNVATPEEDSHDSRVAVSLDNGGSADIPSNSRALFAVPGYQQTTLTINESMNVSSGASSEVTQGSGSRTLFMVPGKMLRRDVQTTASYTWLGQLTDDHHSPFIGGVPLNVNGWSDLGSGGFSAQSNALLHNLYLVRQQQFYQCELNVKSMRDVVRYVGSIPCRELTFSALPASVQQQAQLMLAGRTPHTGPTAMNAEHPNKGK